MNDYIKKRIKHIQILKPYFQETRITKQPGIYLFTRTDEKGITSFYCGQAKNVFNRILGHSMMYSQRIDKSLTKRGFYSESNPNGWKIEILEYCNESELDTKEQEYIMKYLKLGYQTYNLSYGSQGQGKEQLKEYKPPKTYTQGKQYGYLQARRDIAKLFDKNLQVSIVEPSNKHKEKALEKFIDFIKILNENT